MYYIEIYSYSKDKSWTEHFDSYYNFRKRVMKLKYSKDLVIVARSLLENERY